MPTVKIRLYRWAGAWGPFKIQIPCGECSLTRDILNATFEHELQGVPVDFRIKDWLTCWWEPFIKGGWHAPIVMVENKVISQGQALNRGLLSQAVIAAHAKRSVLEGNHLFGKQSCPHCQRAKEYLQHAGIDFIYHDVVESPRALYEMLARVKALVGSKTPITVPQIWLNGHYIGGANELQRLIKEQVEPNRERGQCSLSP